MSLTITTSSISSTSITARVSTTGLVPMEHHWLLDGREYKVQYTNKGTKSSSCTFSGLSSGTSYGISIRVYQIDPWKLLDSGSRTVTTSSSGSGSGTTDPDPGGDTKKRPSSWYWSCNMTRGAPMDLTAREWNSFIRRIEDFADYKGVRLNSSYLYSASASSGGKMLASQANAAISLISQLSPPTSPPSRVQAGSTITASFFLDLRGSLNSIR